MKIKLLAGVAALSLMVSGAALAADLPSRQMAPMAPIAMIPTFTWNGFYVGVNAGYGFGKFTRDGRLFDDPDGFVGGGQIGYNYQIGQFVAGLETDIQYSDMDSRGQTFLTANSKAEVNYFGTVRGRVGIAFDRALVYATGGYAYGQTSLTIPSLRIDDEKTHNGYALGGGIEYAFTNNLTAKAEYLYVDLENKRYSSPITPVKAGAEFSVVRAGLNYKFNTFGF